MALRDLVRRHLTLPDGAVRLADEAAPVGEDAFVTLREIGIGGHQQGTRQFDAVAGVETVRCQSRITISIQAFGNNAVALLQKLRLLFQSTAVMSDLRQMKAVTASLGGVRNLTGILGGGIEERASLDVEFAYTYTLTVAQEAIAEASAQIESTSGGSRDITIS